MSARIAALFDLSEGAIPNGCIAVCQYLDSDGDMKFGVIYDTSEMPLSSTIGLLEVAKQHIYRLCTDD